MEDKYEQQYKIQKKEGKKVAGAPQGLLFPIFEPAKTRQVKCLLKQRLNMFFPWKR